MGVLRDVCAAWTMGDRPPDSLLEIHLGKLLAGTDIPPPVFQHPVGRYRLDCAWTDVFAAVECDGWENHGRSREGFERDRDRDALLGEAGWEIWRYSWAQIVRRSNWFVGNLRRRLDVRRRQLGLA